VHIGITKGFILIYMYVFICIKDLKLQAHEDVHGHMLIVTTKHMTCQTKFPSNYNELTYEQSTHFSRSQITVTTL